jgi:hypothetical protein
MGRQSNAVALIIYVLLFNLKIIIGENTCWLIVSGFLIPKKEIQDAMELLFGGARSVQRLTHAKEWYFTITTVTRFLCVIHVRK